MVRQGMAGGTHDHREDSRNANVLVYVNGELLPRSQAVVSVFDSGFLMGDGVWEGLRLYDGHVPFLDEHLDRLFQGARALDLDIGLDRQALVDAIAGIARLRLRPATEGAVITRQRHRDALTLAIEAMERAREATIDEMSLEFVALDLRLALEATGKIVGRVSTDDILARIFSEFCVGK